MVFMPIIFCNRLSGRVDRTIWICSSFEPVLKKSFTKTVNQMNLQMCLYYVSPSHSFQFFVQSQSIACVWKQGRTMFSFFFQWSALWHTIGGSPFQSLGYKVIMPSDPDNYFFKNWPLTQLAFSALSIHAANSLSFEIVDKT